MNAETNTANRPRRTVALPGCHPVPLASYLKGLGLFRLVAEQADPDARCYWKNEQLVLETKLADEELTAFLLNDYRPSPILAPWNGGSGFYPKDNDTALRAIEGSPADRFSDYRQILTCCREEVSRLGFKEKPEKAAKEKLLQHLRNTLPDQALAWLDAAYLMGEDGPKFPPLLGTGGNDGRLDFTNNFMQRLTEVFDAEQGGPGNQSDTLLRAALFESPLPSQGKAPIGQFDPNSAGGANAGTGFDAPSSVNPWDYLLMLEGALLFAVASAKRLESATIGQLAYPFCVRAAGVGYASESLADEKASRAEMWMPLWDRPTGLHELRSILGEGRAQISGRPARNGVDFARAVATLGVDRGLTAFQRFGFQVRNGLAYFATPLDRLPVQRNRYVRLLEEIDPWLDRFRSRAASTNPEPPAGVASALRRLENSILRLCQTEDPARVQDVLCALGHCERTLARSLRWTRETAHLRPIHGLSVAWANAADTGHAEYRLARSLASSTLLAAKNQLPFRYFLEPVNPWGNHWREENLRDTAWTDGNPVTSLNAILHRQLLIAQNTPAKGETNHFAHFARKTAPLPDIAAFIEDALDESLFADLLWGLGLIDWSGRDEGVKSAPPTRSPNPDALYGLLKLCFAGSSVREASIPIVPAIHNRAAHGDAEEASKLACRRLRASGLAPAVEELASSESHVRRTAAALIFPVSTRATKSLDHQILLQSEEGGEKEQGEQKFDISPVET
ncbi:MAG: type I-G CRISPR-associated protein Cas8g1/Csx17 [Opitutales bacterium]